MPQEKIIHIEKEAQASLQTVQTIADLDVWEVKYLGRKSELNDILKSLKDLSPEEKRVVGPLGNRVKQSLFKAFEETKEILLEKSIDWEAERVDVTAPGVLSSRGHLNPVTLVEHEIEAIFSEMGFVIADGPEIETEHYNFDALNVAADHPARDMQDTFWITSSDEKEKYLPRTQTSPMQVRYMETHTPPFRIVVPGKVFRNESTDASHEHTFHQFECLMVGDDVSIANFKWMAETFFSRFFGKKIDIRLRPSFFPFTEPSFEFDISCTLCDAKGCAVCKQTGWLELGGAGMVNQKVFEAVDYPRGKYQGFAWGFGTTRLAMMKYKITDIRLFMSGDLRFIRQF